jgi:hypothetical protein
MNMSVAQQANLFQLRSGLFVGFASYGLFRALTLFQMTARYIPTPIRQVDQKNFVLVKRIDRGRGSQFRRRRPSAENQSNYVGQREQVEIPRDFEDAFPM